ncbi:MAG TPA: hypothetical protein VKA49_07105 [Flavitalea sp.]|nr:hypothetical protein [Flavitalea sp.]
MKQHYYRQSSIHFFLLALILIIVGASLLSFKTEQLYGDFLKQLGITKQEANDKISSSFLAGGLDYYGIRNVKSIVTNDRAAVVKDIASYAKQYAVSAEYIRQYMALKESNKPEPYKLETPEEMRNNMIRQAKEAVQQTEASLKKAPAEMKAIFEKTLDAAKQNLKQIEDPNNKNIKAYTQNFAAAEKQMKESHENLLKQWEAKYPTNHLLYIKVRLQEFLDATKDIDFGAQLIEKKGVKYFVNPDYERKGNRWKAAFRAGKEAVEAARTFAEQWINEIK